MDNRITSLLAAFLLASVAHGQVLLNKFGPVTGVLVGTAGNPATAAAAIADLQPILSTTPGLVLNSATGGAKGAGTINATGLYVNGSAVGVGGGAVSSVGISVPTGGCFGTSGSPVTSSGTLGVTLSGTTSQYVDGTGGCQTTPVAANPTGHVGTTAANGSAVTFMRSDAAPAIDLTMSPTMTGTWTFTGSTAPQVSVVASIGAGSIRAQGASGSDGYFVATATGAANWSMGAKTSTGVWELCAASTLTGTCPLQISTVGNIAVPAPSSGTAMTINSPDNTAIATFNDSGTFSSGVYVGFDKAGSLVGAIGFGGVLGGGTGVNDIGVLSNSGGVRLISSTGIVVAAPSSGVAETVNGVANQNSLFIVAPNTASQSFGIDVQAGSNSSDWSANFTNAAGASLVKIWGDGGVVIGSPAGGDPGPGGIVNASGYELNGRFLFRTISIDATCASGGCSTGVTNGFTSTVTRSSTGVYVATYAPSFGAAPVCVATPYTSLAVAGMSVLVSPGTTTVTISTFNNTGTATDADFALVCNGA